MYRKLILTIVLAVLGILILSISPNAIRAQTQEPSGPCSGMPDADLTKGGYGKSTPEGSALNMRVDPSKDSATAGQLGNDEAFQVLDEDAVCNHWWWWHIQKSDKTVGWVAAGDLNGPYLLPLESKPEGFDIVIGCSSGPSPKLSLGDQIRVDDSIDVHSAPSLDYDVTAQLGQGQTAKIVGGFTCRPNGPWWMIKFGEKSGWILETADIKVSQQATQEPTS